MIKIRLNVQSRKAIDSTTAKKLLDLLRSHEYNIFEPEKYGLTERMTGVFKSNTNQFADWLTKPGGTVAFKRSKILKYLSVIEDRRPSPYPVLLDGKPIYSQAKPAKVLTNLTMWIELKTADSKKVVDFFKSLSILLDADFGFVTSSEDYDEKNYRVKKIHDTTYSSYMCKYLDDGIPGLYSITLFGKEFVKFYQKEKFQTLGCCNLETLSNGSIVLHFIDDFKKSTTLEVLSCQKKVVSALGHSYFFDISNFDRKLNLVPFMK